MALPGRLTIYEVAKPNIFKTKEIFINEHWLWDNEYKCLGSEISTVPDKLTCDVVCHDHQKLFSKFFT